MSKVIPLDKYRIHFPDDMEDEEIRDFLRKRLSPPPPPPPKSPEERKRELYEDIIADFMLIPRDEEESRLVTFGRGLLGALVTHQFGVPTTRSLRAALQAQKLKDLQRAEELAKTEQSLAAAAKASRIAEAQEAAEAATTQIEKTLSGARSPIEEILAPSLSQEEKAALREAAATQRIARKEELARQAKIAAEKRALAKGIEQALTPPEVTHVSPEKVSKDIVGEALTRREKRELAEGVKRSLTPTEATRVAPEEVTEDIVGEALARRAQEATELIEPFPVPEEEISFARLADPVTKLEAEEIPFARLADPVTKLEAEEISFARLADPIVQLESSVYSGATKVARRPKPASALRRNPASEIEATRALKSEVDRAIKAPKKSPAKKVEREVGGRFLKELLDRFEREIVNKPREAGKIKWFGDEEGSTTLFTDLGQAVVAGIPKAKRLYRLLAGISDKYELPPEVVRPFVDAESHGKTLAGIWQTKMEDAAEALTFRERLYLGRHGAAILQGRQAIPVDMPGVQQYVKAWNETKQQVWRFAEAYGLEPGYIENYFPRSLTRAAKEALLTQQGEVYDAIKKAVGPIAIQSPEDLSSYFFDDILTRRFGHLERSRLLDLPESVVTASGKVVRLYETNPFVVIPQYLGGAGRRLGIVRQFGVNSAQAVNDIINKVIQHPRGLVRAKAVKEIWENLQGIPFDDPIARGIYAITPFTDILRTSLLTLTAIPNAAMGIWPIASIAGWWPTMKISAKVLAGALTGGRFDPGGIARDVELARRIGAWVKGGVMQELSYGFDPAALQIGSRFPTLRRVLRSASEVPVRVTAGEWVNRQLNKIASVAGKDVMERALAAAKAGDARQLIDLAEYFHFSEADIARWMKQGFSQGDLAKVMQLMSARTNLFREFAVDAPRWTKHPIAREFLAFTGILRALATLTYDAVRMAARGNIKPLATMLGGMNMGSLAERVIKDYLHQRNKRGESNLELVADAVLRNGMLGLIGATADDIYQIMSVDPRVGPAEAAFRGAIPPWIKQMDQLLAFFYDGKDEHLRRVFPVYNVFAIHVLGEPPLGRRRKGEKRRSRRSLV